MKIPSFIKKTVMPLTIAATVASGCGPNSIEPRPQQKQKLHTILKDNLEKYVSQDPKVLKSDEKLNLEAAGDSLWNNNGISFGVQVVHKPPTNKPALSVIASVVNNNKDYFDIANSKGESLIEHRKWVNAFLVDGMGLESKQKRQTELRQALLENNLIIKK